MIPGVQSLERLQAEWRFDLSAIEIVLRLMDMLERIRESALLRDRLVLKGGSALNLCFPPLLRLSVDLDFNVLGGIGRDEMLREKPRVLDALTAIARRAGYRLQTSAPEHAGQKLYLRYESALGGQGGIQIDLNFLYRVPVGDVQERALWNPLEKEVVPVLVVSSAELVAGKLLAMLDRAAPRDLFDAASFAKKTELDSSSDAARQTFVALSGTLDRALFEYDRGRFDSITDASVSMTLHPLLHANERPASSALKRAAWETVSPWLKLRPEEREYCERIQQGEFRPDLLCPDDEPFAQVLRSHPALLWKVENAKRHARRGPSPRDGT